MHEIYIYIYEGKRHGFAKKNKRYCHKVLLIIGKCRKSTCMANHILEISIIKSINWKRALVGKDSHEMNLWPMHELKIYDNDLMKLYVRYDGS